MQVSVHAAKTNLSRLLEAVERGERVVIARHGVPTAELVPVKATQVKLGSLKDKLAPPPDDFLAPMSEGELREWGA